jgi:hypothetical protein
MQQKGPEAMATAKFRPPSARGSSKLRLRRRRLVTFLAIGLLSTTLLATHLGANDDRGPRRLLAVPLNRLIAWADLNLQLAPRQGAERALRLDPELRTGLGRQGARWFATDGTPNERLRYALALAMRDSRELPLLRSAVNAARCSADPRLWKATVATAARARLPLEKTSKGRRPC